MGTKDVYNHAKKWQRINNPGYIKYADDTKKVLLIKTSQI